MMALQTTAPSFAMNMRKKIAESVFFIKKMGDATVHRTWEKALETDADYVQGTVRRTNSNTGEVRLWERKDSDNVKTKIIGFQGGIYRTKMLQECGVKFGPFRIGDDTCFALMILRIMKNH